MEKKLVDKLLLIQHELKAPKNAYNSFGKYKYRSCESILEAVKPLLFKYKCQLTLSDDVVLIGERYYIKATATFIDLESCEKVECTAVAREENEKKGMDASQISGTASSYCRKYCLNGLFLIDDQKDADTDEYQEVEKELKENKVQLATDREKKSFMEMCEALSLDPTEILTKVGWKKGEKMTKEQFGKAQALLQGMGI